MGWFFSTDEFGVALWNGDGTFTPARSYGAIGYPSAMAVGDLNSDGVPDVFVADYYCCSGQVFLGHGDGTFSAPAEVASGSVSQSPFSLVLEDFDGDGALDAAITARRSATMESPFYGAKVTARFGTRSTTRFQSIPSTSSSRAT